MAKILKLTLILTCSLGVLFFGSKSYAQDKIIAIVNNEIITQKDFTDFVNFMKMQLSEQYSGKELETKIQNMKVDLLDKLIDDHLILQEAEKEKIKIDDNRVKARVGEIKKRYRSDVEFENDLMRQGLTQSDVEKKVREQILMYYAVEAKVKSKIRIRPEEITEFYNKNVNEFIIPGMREFQTIALENEDQAKSFLLNLRSGEQLEDLAARYPIKVDKLEAAAGDLKKEIEDAVSKLDIGGISNPIKIGDKYIIFKLENITPSKKLALSEVQDKIKALIFNNKMQEEMTKWLDELRQNSYIKIMQS